MQDTRKMNLVQVLFDQASYTLLGMCPQRQQPHADKTSSFNHIILSAELSLSVMQCVSC